MGIDQDLEEYVTEVLADCEPERSNRNKIIYDAVLGTHELKQIEINLIDSPLVQRLRYISQTGFTYLTYPSARHSRFEHSLGVSIMANKMANALKANSPDFDDITFKEVRIAGLLHDIGHGPFSHTSEDIIGKLPDVKEAFKDEKFKGTKPHELISYKLINTKRFKNYFKSLCEVYGEKDVSLDNISNMIIGKVSDEKYRYKSEIINGSFDSDKLDYLMRDAYFTGLKLSIDLDRLFITQKLENRKKQPKRIIGDIGGVHVLEQILFGKMLLFPSVYHHHKVRACECMLKGLFEYIKENDIRFDGLKFEKVSDFLKIDDLSILNTVGKEKNVRDRIMKIKQRKLLKRALVIKKSTLKDPETFSDLLGLKDRGEELREIAKIINESETLKDCCEYHDIWIDLPTAPNFPEPSSYLIQQTVDRFIKLVECFPLAAWSDSYEVNKWTGYIFGPPELQRRIGEISQLVLEDVFDLKFDEQAQILAKYPEEE